VRLACSPDVVVKIVEIDSAQVVRWPVSENH
jgi:hypothetical protein